MHNKSFRVKFYGSNGIIKNKLYCFKVSGKSDALGAIGRFKRNGMDIRAAWIDVMYGNEIVSNIRII